MVNGCVLQGLAQHSVEFQSHIVLTQQYCSVQAAKVPHDIAIEERNEEKRPPLVIRLGEDDENTVSFPVGHHSRKSLQG